MTSLDLKVIKKKKLDKLLTLRVLQHESAERIFVEFSSKDGRMVLNRSFQDTYLGREEAKVFEESFKTIEDLTIYFGKKK